MSFPCGVMISDLNSTSPECNATQSTTIKPNASLSNLTRSSTSTSNLPQLSKFVNGYHRFHREYFSDDKKLYSELQKGQTPKTVLIGCCDSRVDPAIITDCDPGDLFVIRNVANLVPPYSPDPGHHGTSAALEYAVKVLKVENIIVLGHRHCGGIKALLNNQAESFEFLESWMAIAKESKELILKEYANSLPEEKERACEQASIAQSLKLLGSYPWIADRVSTGQVQIVGWYFDFDTGDLSAYDSETSSFEPLVRPAEPFPFSLLEQIKLQSRQHTQDCCSEVK